MKKILLLSFFGISATAISGQKLNAQHIPSVPSIIAIPDSVCSGDSALLYVTGINGATYVWNTGATTDSIYVNPISSTTYSVYITQGVNHYSDSVTIKIIPPITASLYALPDTICPSGSVTLTATASGGQATYKWSTGATTSSIIVTPVVTTTYTATIYGRCDSVKRTVTINVVPLPIPVISGTSWKCKGITDTLTVTSSTHPTDYLWSNGSTTTSYITGPIEADSTIRVVAYNSLGCSDTAQFIIKLREPCPTDVPSISETDFANVYPNPSSTKFTIELQTKSQINVCDITGRLLFSEIENAGTITFGKELNPGMYFLFIDGKPGVKVVKL